MKITHNKVGQNLNLTDASKTDKAAEKSKAGATKEITASAVQPSQGDAVKVDLSSRAQDIQRIRELANGAPDVDQAKVDKFQKLIDSGKYKVDSKAVADRLVDEHLFSVGDSSNE
ncbi:MAG: flagellar biosynthesis anti-sigma factor FlgM [Bdellovibrionaceae bacterium]|nr:flagellar biosynthesis anti-sigma factor FlgM [Bdellovibrio sp.]